MKSMAKSMLAILGNPKHPINRIINAKLPGQVGDGEPLDVISSRGMRVLRKYRGSLVKDVIASEFFGRGYISL